MVFNFKKYEKMRVKLLPRNKNKPKNVGRDKKKNEIKQSSDISLYLFTAAKLKKTESLE